MHKAYNLDKSYLLLVTLESLASGYRDTGFYPQAEFYYRELFSLNKDTLDFYYNMAFMEWSKKDLPSSINWGRKSLELKPLNLRAIDFLTFRYAYARDYENAIKYFKLYLNHRSNANLEKVSDAHRFAYNFYLLGDTLKARKYFEIAIKLKNNSIESEDLPLRWGGTYYDLFAIYAFLEEYETAFEYLDKLEKVEFYPSWFMSYFEFDPLIDKVREDPRYVEFLNQANIKFQHEHERVKEWLAEEGRTFLSEDLKIN